VLRGQINFLRKDKRRINGIFLPWRQRCSFRSQFIYTVFRYVRNKFPNVSDAKIKAGTFIGPQIRELMQDKQFDQDLNKTERNAWL
jgi:hypothetical protein